MQRLVQRTAVYLSAQSFCAAPCLLRTSSWWNWQSQNFRDVGVCCFSETPSWLFSSVLKLRVELLTNMQLLNTTDCTLLCKGLEPPITSSCNTLSVLHLVLCGYEEASWSRPTMTQNDSKWQQISATSPLRQPPCQICCAWKVHRSEIWSIIIAQDHSENLQ